MSNPLKQRHLHPKKIMYEFPKHLKKKSQIIHISHSDLLNK